MSTHAALRSSKLHIEVKLKEPLQGNAEYIPDQLTH